MLCINARTNIYDNTQHMNVIKYFIVEFIVRAVHNIFYSKSSTSR